MEDTVIVVWVMGVGTEGSSEEVIGEWVGGMADEEEVVGTMGMAGEGVVVGTIGLRLVTGRPMA